MKSKNCTVNQMDIILNFIKENNKNENDERIIGYGLHCFVLKLSDDIVVKFSSLNDVSLKKEAEILLKLEQLDSVPNLIYYDETHDMLFMDYIEGKTLDLYMVDEVLSLKVFNSLLEGLLNIINLGIEPSDIHSGNIMVTPDNKVKIIDVEKYIELPLNCYQIEIPVIFEEELYDLLESFRDYFVENGVNAY